ncbi:hypothetical protein SERLADRAFT_351200 [Serpula lacrymans var. lacrymans S7.9]|nr:uncharacterized protein SERLADRAFT_351200 [Serpula lacrymans var. lacrymans S7.9]EGO21860.1 hypothetical protein SERLADRAFT_351200 [Serpula lacrymans var. lacrymans S7.9]
MHSDAVPFSRPATPGIQSLQIGWYGLGAMGYFMARNLANSRKSQASSSPVIVYNRSSAKSEKLAKELGSAVKIAQSPAQLATECDVVFTNLASDGVVKAVYEDFAKALAQSPPTRAKIFVDTSTVYPTLSGEVDKLISSFPHCHFVTCPVFGPPPGADKATLVLAMSGDYRSKKEIAYLLVPAVGRKIMDLGGNIEKAPTLKLIGNSLILGANELLSETFTLGEKSGIGAQTVQNLVKGCYFCSFTGYSLWLIFSTV